MLRTDHMVFPVWDVERSLKFYADDLGLPLVAAHQGDDWNGKPWLMMVFAVGDGREIVLVAIRGVPQPPAGEEQADWITKLSMAGVDYWQEDHGRQHSVYFADPNGVILEITTPPSQPGAAPDRRARETVLAWIDQGVALTH